MVVPAYKHCTACGIEKQAVEFSPDRRASTGLQSQCLECSRAAKKRARDADLDAFRARERAYVAANKDRVYALNNDYRLRNQEKVKATKKAAYERDKQSAEFIAKRDAYVKANKERKREYDREYRAARPEKCAQRAKAWVSANPDKRKAICFNYAAKRRAWEKSGVTAIIMAEWTAKQKKVCYWCGVKCAKAFHVDHYEPLSKGGLHELSNLVIACGPCNLRKNAKDPLDFAREVGRLL